MNTPEMYELALQENVDLIHSARMSLFKELGSPEQLCGLEFSEWNPEVVALLSQIYGDEMQNIIFERQLKQVKALEKAVENA